MAELISAYSPSVWGILLATGVLIGLLAGFLGVGGGVIAVPILLEVFDLMGVAEPAAIALAVGTAQASILLSSVTAVAAHWRAGTIDRTLVRAWLPALIVGTVLGLAFSPFAPARLLTALFAVVAAMLAFKLALGDRLIFASRTPIGPFSLAVPAIVGALAAAVGVGGGTLSTPVLSLFSFPIKRAIGAGALFNLLISLPATAFFLAADLGAPRPAGRCARRCGVVLRGGAIAARARCCARCRSVVGGCTGDPTASVVRILPCRGRTPNAAAILNLPLGKCGKIVFISSPCKLGRQSPTVH